MSKITFRADDDLIDRLEGLDASKSAVMREALRDHLEASGIENARSARTTPEQPTESEPTLDGLLAERVDALVAERLNNALRPASPSDINVNVTFEGTSVDSATVSDETSAESETTSTDPPYASEGSRKTCSGCGEMLSSEHVYCPNCGEKSSKPFCQCGEELRSDWAFCPTCGARTPAAEVLDNP